MTSKLTEDCLESSRVPGCDLKLGQGVRVLSPTMRRGSGSPTSGVASLSPAAREMGEVLRQCEAREVGDTDLERPGVSGLEERRDLGGWNESGNWSSTER